MFDAFYNEVKYYIQTIKDSDKKIGIKIIEICSALGFLLNVIYYFSWGKQLFHSMLLYSKWYKI